MAWIEIRLLQQCSLIFDLKNLQTDDLQNPQTDTILRPISASKAKENIQVGLEKCRMYLAKGLGCDTLYSNVDRS